MTTEYGHYSVLLEESLKDLPLDTGSVFVDGTLGGGGHSEMLLKRSSGRLIAIDKDSEAIERSRKRLAPFANRISYIHDDFKNIRKILDDLDLDEIDGAILDLGVSSFQLDEGERGFSYAKEAPLDMRMNSDNPLTAEAVVNEYGQKKLMEIIFAYGEESFAPRIAAAIVKARPIKTTVELAEVIKNAIPAAKRRTGGHPAKKTFQAIRIEVNAELEGLETAIDNYIDLLSPGGAISVISFHSLEDRAVKRAFKTAENPCTCPPDFPQCICGKKPKGRMITRKPILPSEAELKENLRSRSAKLRIFQKNR